MLLTWREKTAGDERYSWWADEMAEKDIEPVKVSLRSRRVPLRRMKLIVSLALDPFISLAGP